MEGSIRYQGALLYHIGGHLTAPKQEYGFALDLQRWGRPRYSPPPD